MRWKKELVKEWTTRAGLAARVYRITDHRGPKRYWRSWYTGYVRVPREHDLFEVGYIEALLSLRAGEGGQRDLSWSGRFTDDNGWWFGFDTATYEEDPGLDHVVGECEALAEDLARLA